MTIQLPFLIVLAGLSLIMICVTLPSMIMFAMIMKGEDRLLEKLEAKPKRRYAPPEYMERLYHDPKAGIYFTPRGGRCTCP